MPKIKIFLITLVLLLGIAGNAPAVTYNWDDGVTSPGHDPNNHRWDTVTNWNPDRIPTAADDVRIDYKDPNIRGPEIYIGGEGESCNNLIVGGYYGGGSKVFPKELLIVTNYNYFDVSKNISIGNCLTEEDYWGYGIIYIKEDGALRTKKMSVGDQSQGELIMTGGTVCITGTDTDEYFDIGCHDQSTGHVQLDSGIILTTKFRMNYLGTHGTMDITDGRLIIDGNVVEQIRGYVNEQNPNKRLTACGGTAPVSITYYGWGNQTIVEAGGVGSYLTLTIKTEPNNIGINTITPSIGQHSYYPRSVSISATTFLKCPDTWTFDHWEGDSVDNPNSASTKIRIDTDKMITAVFKCTQRRCGDKCHPIPKGDLNGDCYINLNDFAIYAVKWLSCTHPDCDTQ